MKLKIKKGATVQVITGSDKGKKGSVLADWIPGGGRAGGTCKLRPGLERDGRIG